MGDLRGRETAYRPQRESDRRRAGERGMAAHEEQDEGVVLIRVFIPIGSMRHLLVRWYLTQDRSLTSPASLFGAQVIGHSPDGYVDQPAARVVRHAFVWPLQGRCDQRLLDRILRCREVAEAPDHSAENLRRKISQQVLGREVGQHGRHISGGGALITSRTSMAMFSGTPPRPGAADAPAAIS